MAYKITAFLYQKFGQFTGIISMNAMAYFYG
jgi:hypothetical protein